MKIRTTFLLGLFICLNLICQARTNHLASDTLYATQLKPCGRYLTNKHNDLELISSAAHFGFTFWGEECAIYAFNKYSEDHNYIQYELDGVYQKRLRVDGKPTGPIIIKTTKTGPHTIWIYKTTEAHTGAVVISKIAAGRIKPLPVSKAPLIEFIGNSITCGAASDTSDFPCGTGQYHDHHNAYMAYGPRLARALGMNYVLSSVSGIGVYRTWNADGPSMPEVYENTDFKNTTSDTWDFNTFKPKIVSIALGTNDLSTGDGKTPRAPFSEQLFINNFVNFIKLVKTKYPKARIVLLSSPMVKGNSKDVLEKCLTAIKGRVDAAYPSDKPIANFFFPAMDAHGCAGHPSVAEHAILAKQLEPFFKNLLAQ